MKYTNRKKPVGFFAWCLLISMVLMSLTGCGQAAYSLAYEPDAGISGFNIIGKNNAETAGSFAEQLCVITADIMDDENIDMSSAEAAILCDVNNSDVLYSKNAHERLNPASLTKIMTAIVALKYGSYDQVLTATDAVTISESGAQLCGLKPGDTMTLNQALHVLLLYSANDAAMLIAENIGGSVDQFVEMMNEEARALGATNTHFANPHGLTDEEHYTTAYDLYLIFNEAIKYDKFLEIIQMSSYETTYNDKNGDAKQLSVKSTNRFLTGDSKAPENVTVIGGKTGTTAAAGHCLILLARDFAGAPYIAIVMKTDATDELYDRMTDLLNEIGN